MSAALPDLSIARARERIASGQLSPVALVEAHLSRIAQANDQLNAFRTVLAEPALAQANRVEEAARRGDPLGPLAGIPVALKDNIEVAGVPMTAGTPYLGAGLAPADAPVWERMRRAGAVLLGKLHMSEWAIGGTTQNVHYGPCHNPWDPERVSGGSSGGSGTAIAADMAMAALGTDTGGSARIPAALCGVSALRPSGGRVSNRGSVPVAWTFDAICPMARRAEDVAQVLAVIAGYDHEDPASLDVRQDDYLAGLERGAEGLRIGLLVGDWLEDPLPAIAAAVREAAAVLERLGAVVEELELPGRAEAFDLAGELVLAEAAWFHRERLRDSPEMYGPDVL
ncbi:MAG: amidase, partial [Solirubrobacteraceae bacterium]